MQGKKERNSPVEPVFEMNAKHKITASWSGSYPCLCHGRWTLTIDGKDCIEKIPEKMRDEPMNTFGTYSRWGFSPSWSEEWEEYEDGLREDEWIRENIDWLMDLPIPAEYYKHVFIAFQKEDFRTGQCGGCI